MDFPSPRFQYKRFVELFTKLNRITVVYIHTFLEVFFGGHLLSCISSLLSRSFHLLTCSSLILRNNSSLSSSVSISSSSGSIYISSKICFNILMIWPVVMIVVEPLKRHHGIVHSHMSTFYSLLFGAPILHKGAYILRCVPITLQVHNYPTTHNCDVAALNQQHIIIYYIMANTSVSLWNVLSKLYVYTLVSYACGGHQLVMNVVYSENGMSNLQNSKQQ